MRRQLLEKYYDRMMWAQEPLSTMELEEIYEMEKIGYVPPRMRSPLIMENILKYGPEEANVRDIDGKIR